MLALYQPCQQRKFQNRMCSITSITYIVVAYSYSFDKTYVHFMLMMLIFCTYWSVNSRTSHVPIRVRFKSHKDAHSSSIYVRVTPT